MARINKVSNPKSREDSLEHVCESLGLKFVDDVDFCQFIVVYKPVKRKFWDKIFGLYSVVAYREYSEGLWQVSEKFEKEFLDVFRILGSLVEVNYYLVDDLGKRDLTKECDQSEGENI